MERSERAEIHAALGDEIRLTIVDELTSGDRSSTELVALTGVSGNLLAHHLGVLQSAGLIERRSSEGDRRRRYVILRPEHLLAALPASRLPSGTVLFVCTRNSARSQFAAALWRARGLIASSAGTHPAPRLDPRAVQVAGEHGLDLSEITPCGYDSIAETPVLIISVCDRAREAGLPFRVPHRHWSVPDPVMKGTLAAFRSAFEDIADRVDRLARATETSTGREMP